MSGGLSFTQKYGFLAALTAGLAASGLEWKVMILFVLLVWLFLGGHKTIYLTYHTLGRDLRAVTFFVKLLLLVKRAERKNWNVPKMFSETVNETPDKIMFYFEDQQWTFREVDHYSNRVANFFLTQGFGKGDCVALFMENRPEYVATWLGLAKVGVVPALINYNLKHHQLIHTIKVAKAKAVVYGAELESSITEVADEIEQNEPTFKFFCSGVHGKSFGNVVLSTSNINPPLPEVASTVSRFTDLDSELEISSTKPVDKSIQDTIGFKDKLLYIYTSGTTGLPKAAVIKHSRFYLGSSVARHLAGVKPQDTLYNPLPLYHSSAGMLAVGAASIFGVSIALRKKFSATHFWSDCVRYNATVSVF